MTRSYASPAKSSCGPPICWAEFDVTCSRPGKPPIGAQIALVSHDLDRDWQRAVAAGAAVVKLPEAKPWGQVVGYLKDVNGVIVELCTPSLRP